MIPEDNKLFDIGDSEEYWEEASLEDSEMNDSIQDIEEDLIDQISRSENAIKVDFVQQEETMDDYAETLQLVEYVNPESNNQIAIVAEYDNINIVNVEKRTKKQAQELVNKITKFVIEFNDVELSEEHITYINHVGTLELNGLQDILTLVEFNKGMIANMVRRINSVQADDYAMIASYTQLINQQMRLIKDLQIRYKAIPAVIKKMRAEILCNQELGENETTLKNLTHEIETTTNLVSNKDMIRDLRKKYEEKNP